MKTSVGVEEKGWRNFSSEEKKCRETASLCSRACIAWEWKLISGDFIRAHIFTAESVKYEIQVCGSPDVPGSGTHANMLLRCLSWTSSAMQDDGSRCSETCVQFVECHGSRSVIEW